MAKFKGIGEGLLSNLSKELKLADDSQLIHLDIHLIDPNENNKGLSLDNIEELAQSILENGLDQNLVVCPTVNGRYKILSGHRRRLAILHLLEQGHTEFRYPLAMVKDTAKVKLNISQSGKEKYAMLTTNLQRRKNTVADNLHLMQQANEVFDELQKNGENVGKRREWVAEQLGISPSSIKNLKYIDENIAPEFREEIEREKLPLTVAVEIAHLPQPEQKQLHKQTADAAALSMETVKDFRETKEKSKNASVSWTHHIGKEFYGPIDEILNQQKKDMQETVSLTEKDYDKILEAQRIIQRQLEKINIVIEKSLSRKTGW